MLHFNALLSMTCGQIRRKSERLLQIRNQIIRMFQANGEPQKVFRAASVGAFSRGAMFDQAMRSAQNGGVAEELERSSELKGFSAAAFYLDGHHAAEAGHLPASDFVSGVRGQAGIVNCFKPGLPREKFSDALCAG